MGTLVTPKYMEQKFLLLLCYAKNMMSLMFCCSLFCSDIGITFLFPTFLSESDSPIKQMMLTK